MYCLKCGKDTKNEQVFCDACLENMLPYPVKPDAVVTLPHRETTATKKQSGRKRPQSPEEQVVHLRKLVRRLLLALAVMTVLLGLAAAMLLKIYFGPATSSDIGKNYTIDTTWNP